MEWRGGRVEWRGGRVQCSAVQCSRVAVECSGVECCWSAVSEWNMLRSDELRLSQTVPVG